MYTIGQLAKRAHVNTDSVRFYERQGLRAEIELTIVALHSMSKYLAELAAAHPLNSARPAPPGVNSGQGEQPQQVYANI